MTRTIAFLLIIVGFQVCHAQEIKSTKDQDSPEKVLPYALEDMEPSSEDYSYYNSLIFGVMGVLDEGKIEEAKKMVAELQELIPVYKSYNADAIHKVNVAQGRLALKEGRIEEAKQFLILAGTSEGSAVMNTFGPNMSLAHEFIVIGETSVAIQYLDLCKKFWRMEDGKIEQWKEEISNDIVPDFGANMVY